MYIIYLEHVLECFQVCNFTFLNVFIKSSIEAIMWCYFGSTARRLTDIVTKSMCTTQLLLHSFIVLFHYLHSYLEHASFGVWQQVLMVGEIVIAIIVFIMIGVIGSV